MHKGPRAVIWKRVPNERARAVKAVCARLENAFGNPRLGNPTDPIDDLIFLMLSNRTQATTAQNVYTALKALRPSWNEIASLPKRTIERTIQRAGFAGIRSAQIKGTLKAIQKRLGACRLDELRQWREQGAHEFLVSLPGVSDKVAKCVMMYTLGFAVLPVDVHVFRVSTRLGWTSRCRAAECHADLETLVSPELRYGFHVNCVALGRAFCRSTEPNCAACPISKFCVHFAQRTHEPVRQTKSHRSIRRGRRV
jgi:endonuclease III